MNLQENRAELPGWARLQPWGPSLWVLEAWGLSLWVPEAWGLSLGVLELGLPLAARHRRGASGLLEVGQVSQQHRGVHLDLTL